MVFNDKLLRIVVRMILIDSLLQINKIARDIEINKGAKK